MYAIRSYYDPATQSRVLARVLEYRKGQTIVWALSRAEFAERFDKVFVLERGKLVEHGAFESLNGSGGMLHKLLHAA